MWKVETGTDACRALLSVTSWHVRGAWGRLSYIKDELVIALAPRPWFCGQKRAKGKRLDTEGETGKKKPQLLFPEWETANPGHSKIHVTTQGRMQGSPAVVFTAVR